MRAHLLPPPARHPFGPSASLARVLLVLGAAGLAVIGLWLVLGLGPADRGAKGGFGLALWAGCAALAWRWWRRLPCGELVWDGMGWTIEQAGRQRTALLVGPPEVRLDMQSALLLHARPVEGAALWLWLPAGRAADPSATWVPMRRALYSRALVAPVQDDSDARPSNETPA